MKYIAHAVYILISGFLCGLSGYVIADMDGDGNSVSVVVGGIDGLTEGTVSIQGVAIINDKVWIDGKEIPHNVVRFLSKSGLVYLIKRNSSGVEVTTEPKRRMK